MAPNQHVMSVSPATGGKMWNSQVLVMTMLLAVQVMTSSAILISGVQPETLLEDLSPEELDDLFDSSLEVLQSEIVQIYERHLENYYRSVGNLNEVLSREIRDTRVERSLLPTFERDFWHPWNGDIQFDNREVLKIEQITPKKGSPLGNVDIDKVFHLNLWNLPAIYLSVDGTAMIMKEGKLEPLYVRNSRTTSITGCTCHDQVSDNCACCVPGSCLCKEVEGYFGNVCVPCGQESSEETCAGSSPYQLKTKVVTGFEYYLDNYDPVEGLQRVIITSNETTVNFYKFDDEGLQPMVFEDGRTTMSFTKPITHLGFGETYRDLHGSVQKQRFLFTFGAGENSHQFHGLGVASKKLRSGLSQMWHTNGTDMKVWSSGRRIMVGVQIGNDILIHEMKANRFHDYQVMHIQTISSGDQVRSWKSFSMNFENYLMVVSPTLAKIYHQNGIYYEPMQDLEPTGGLSTFQDIAHLTIPSCRDKAILLTGEGRKIVAYVWNGTAQQLEPVYSTTLDVVIEDWSITSGHTDAAGLGPTLVVVKGENGAMSLEINATLQALPDPLSLQAQALQENMENLEEEYQRQESIMKTFQEKLDNSVEGKNELIGPIIIRNKINVGVDLETGTLIPESVFLEVHEHHGVKMKTDYYHHVDEHTENEEGLETLGKEIRSTLDVLQDAVLVGDTGKVIDGKKTLVKGRLNVGRLNATEMNFSSSVDETGQYFPLGKVLSNIVRRDYKTPITGAKIFTKPLSVDNLIAEYIDDIPVKDLITTNEEAIIAGATFLTPLVAETIVISDSASIGGVPVSSIPSVNESFSLGHCTFLNDLTVDEVTVKSNIVDDIDIERLSLNTLTTTGGILKGPLEFTGKLDVKKLEAKSIMGINTSKFMAETVFTDQPADIQGTLTLPGMSVANDLFVNGDLNGKRFPDAYPILNDGVVQFGAMRFDHLEIDSLKMEVSTRVDGLSIDKIVTLSTEQYILGHKHFAGGITILGNLDISSKLLDGINLDQLNESIYAPQFPEDKDFEVIFGGDLRVPSITYNGTLNHLDFDDLAKDLLYDDESPIVVESTKTFKSGLNVSNAVFEDTFNGEDLSKLVTLDKEQTITGSKTFSDGVSFTTIDVVGLVDDTDLSQLEKDAVYRDKPGQVVTGKKIFTGTVHAKELEVIGKVNGVDFTHVVTRDGAQTFTAPQTILNGEFNHIAADAIQMDEPIIVNDINLSEINERRISLTSPFRHTGTLTVTGPVSVNGSLFTNIVNNHDLAHVLDNIVMTNEPAVVDSSVVFSNLSVYGSITTNEAKGANGLNIEEINAKAVHLNEDGVLSGNTEWDNMILESGITGKGLFNGFDLHELSKDAVFKNIQDQFITGKKTFVNGFSVKGNIEAATINGVDLRNRLLSRSTEQTITASYTFTTMVVEKDIHIVGKFNSVDMSKMDSAAMKQHEITLRGNVTFYNTVNVNHLKLIDGYLNDIKLADHLDDAVKLDDSDVEITGKKTFTQHLESPNIVVRLLNGVDFSDFLNHLVFLDSPGNIRGTVTVNGVVTTPEISADELEVKGSIEGLDVQALENDVIYLHEDRIINATLIITDDVHVEGIIDVPYLNGRNIETDYLTIDTEQTIPSDASFNNIWTDDVDVGGLVNSWNLPHELQNTLMTTGGQTVTGAKRFTGPVKVLGSVEVTGRVGTDSKLKLARQAVKLDEEAQIEGLLIFNEPLRVNHLSSSTDMINGINYTELCDKAWISNQPAIITGRMSFTAEAHFMDGLVYNSPNGEPTLGDLQRQIMALNSEMSETKLQLNKQYSELCGSVVSLNKKLEDSIYEGEYFDVISREKVIHQRHSSISFQSFNHTFVVVSWEGPVCDSTLYKFDPESSKLKEMSTIKESGYGHQWLFLEKGDTKYLAMAASSSGNTCNRQSSTVWKLNENFTMSVHQVLVPGERLSLKYLGGGGMKIFVHSANQTTIYKFNPTTQLFEVYNAAAENIDLALTLHLKDATNVMFRTQKGYGKVLINGKAGPRTELARDITDAVLFQQNEHVFIVLSAVTYEKQKTAHVIQLYSVDAITKSLRWLDLKDVASPANLTSFFAGNEASGTTFIVVAQNNRFPIVYTLLGEKLKMFTELDVPRGTWMQHLAVRGQKDSSFPDHFVLFGQKDKTLLLTQLVMKGASASRDATDLVDCNEQFLTNDHFDD